MKILVTGGVGKVGQWVVRDLLDGGAHQVTVFDRLPGPERGPVKYLVGDVQDLGQVIEAMADVEAVIHLAAIHNPNIATASVTYQTNVVGTFNVHHAAFRLGIKRVVSASSNAIVGWSYGEHFVPDYLPSMKIIPFGLKMSMAFQSRSARRSRNHTAVKVWRPSCCGKAVSSLPRSWNR